MEAEASDTLDQYCVLMATVSPGVGIAPHQHPDQEAFFVLDEKQGRPEIQQRMVENLTKADAEYGQRVAEGIGLKQMQAEPELAKK
jgi:hypothetical protein